MKIIENFESSFDIEKLKKMDKQKTKVFKYITYKKRTEQEVRNKFKGQIEEEMLEEIIDYLKEAIAPIYSCIEEVGDIPDCDVVKVRLNGKWGIVSKADGKVILEIMYDNIFSFFKEDNFAVIQLNERYRLIERKFRELVPPIYGITEIPEVKRQIVKVTENIYFFNEEEMNTTTE